MNSSQIATIALLCAALAILIAVFIIQVRSYLNEKKRDKKVVSKSGASYIASHGIKTPPTSPSGKEDGDHRDISKPETSDPKSDEHSGLIFSHDFNKNKATIIMNYRQWDDIWVCRNCGCENKNPSTQCEICLSRKDS